MLLYEVCLLCIVLTSSTDQELHTLIHRMEKKIEMLEMEVSELRLWKSNFEKKSKENVRKERLLMQQIDFKSGVAFSAYLSTSFKAASFGNSREMVYDKIECNVGNGFDNNTGTFRAHIKGTYSLTWSVCASGTDQGEIGVELLINNQIHGSVWVDSEQVGDEDCSTVFVIHTLNAGDVVFTRSHSTGALQGSVRSDQYMRTTFSGWVLF